MDPDGQWAWLISAGVNYLWGALENRFENGQSWGDSFKNASFVVSGSFTIGNYETPEFNPAFELDNTDSYFYYERLHNQIGIDPATNPIAYYQAVNGLSNDLLGFTAYNRLDELVYNTVDALFLQSTTHVDDFYSYDPINGHLAKKNYGKFLELVQERKITNATNVLLAGWAVGLAEPSPIGEGVMIAATLATTIVYGPELVEKMQREIDRIATKPAGPPGFQYSLRAITPGYYPNVRGGTIWLNTGDVWKYGETTQGFGRYSDTYLNGVGMGLEMVPEVFGTQVEIKIAEKSKIYGYFFTYGYLPPGNKIFR